MGKAALAIKKNIAVIKDFPINCIKQTDRERLNESNLSPDSLVTSVEIINC